VAQAIEAVEAISSKAYDAVMVDSSREGLNGYEVASLLKDNAHTQGTTIILTTDNAPDENLALESGADRTIEKPLQGDQLLRSLITAGKCQISH
jgi:CheY-like chemotaxis protein